MKLIEVDECLEAKLEKFEGTFEKDEILETYLIIEKIVKYFHYFIQVIIIFQLFFTSEIFIKKSKFEIQIVKSGYEN